MNPPPLVDVVELLLLGSAIETPIVPPDLITFGAYESYVAPLHHPCVVLSLHRFRADRREGSRS